jgi:tetratricopeptide (TPR) repeat protein
MRLSIRILPVLFAMVLLLGTPMAFGATADEYYKAGLQLYQAKDYAKAVQYFDAALKTDPNHTGAARGAGNCHVALNQTAQAIPYYEKALALSPNDAQLAAYVQNLKAQAPAPSSGPSGPSGQAAQAAPAAPAAPAAAGGSFTQGKSLFDLKQYAQAQPLFQKAVEENPSDANAWFYLGYCQYSSGDKKGAALSFARSNQISPNPKAVGYAQSVKATLAPADQAWVDAELAKGLPTAAPAAAVKTAAAPVKPKSFGIRLVPGIAMFTLGDLKKDSDAKRSYTAILQQDGYDDGVTAISPDPSIGLDGKIPTGGLSFAVEPVVPLGNSVELGMHFEFLQVGKYEVTITNKQEGDREFTIRNSMKISAMPLGMCGRVLFSPPEKKMRPYLGFSVLYLMTSIDYSSYSKIYDAYPAQTVSGKLKGSAIGGGLCIGADYALTPSVVLSPFVGYRMLKAKNYKGTVNDSDVGLPYDAELRTTNGSGAIPAGHVIVVPTDPVLAGEAATATGVTSVDFGGLQAGLGIGFYF